MKPQGGGNRAMGNKNWRKGGGVEGWEKGGSFGQNIRGEYGGWFKNKWAK